MVSSSLPATGLALFAPTDEANALRLTPIAPTALRTYPLTHPYVEIVFTPSLGPTPIALARYIGRILAAHDSPVTVCTVALAHELGIRARQEQPLGMKSSLRRSLDRLEWAQFIEWIDDHHIAVQTEIPAVNDQARSRLPPAARYAHDQFIDVIDLRGR